MVNGTAGSKPTGQYVTAEEMARVVDSLRNEMQGKNCSVSMFMKLSRNKSCSYTLAV